MLHKSLRLLLILSLIIINVVISKGSTCVYYNEIENNATYYAYNPKYPNYETSAVDCQWQLTSKYLIQLNCTIDIAKSYQCLNSHVETIDANGEQHLYCGDSNFLRIGTNFTIKYINDEDFAGNFFCTITAMKPFDKNNCQCGWHKNSFHSKRYKRIVNGEETHVNEYNMMAGIIDFQNKQVFCGGVIISNSYILTAAHCVEDNDVQSFGVVVGEHDLIIGTETNATKLYKILKYIVYPYKTNIAGNIAIIKIEGNIEYSPEVGPACLPFQHKEDSFGGSTVTALGWGLLNFGGLKPTQLQRVNLNVINLQHCKYYISGVNHNNICTYTPDKGPCQMDAGGPLLWENPTTKNLVLIGIITSGIACGGTEPDVSDRVGAYIDWITSVTPGTQFCKIE